MNHILMLGAGFSRNWGGWTSEELIGDLLGRLAATPDIQRRLQTERNFESVFSELLGRSKHDATPEAREAFACYQAAIRRSFEEMNQAYVRLENELDFFDIKTAAPEKEKYRVNRFLESFDAIFTLNQDLLLELFYRPNQTDAHRWNEIYFPMVEQPDQWTKVHWSKKDRMQLLRETWTTDAPLAPPPEFGQPVYKLHGSVNWRTADNKEVFVIGANKDADIQRSQTLRLYAEEFIRRISETPTRLMVIGYSFRDEHINNAILSAAKLKNLSLFVVDPEGYDVFKSDFPAHVTDYSPFSGLQFINQRKELIRIPCVGISTRPLSSTFRDDVLEWDKLFRFFVAPPVEPITP